MHSLFIMCVPDWGRMATSEPVSDRECGRKMKGARSPPDETPRLARRHPLIVQLLWASLGWVWGGVKWAAELSGGRGGLNK